MAVVRTRSNKQAGAFAGVVFLLVGVGALVGGAYWGLRTKTFLASAERADGRVIELVARRGDDGTTYAPKVRFTTKDGAQETFTSSSSSNPPSHREGDAVTVLYEPERPSNAKIDSFMDLWFGPLMVGGVFGIIFTLVGAAVTLQGVRAMVMRRRLRQDGLRIVAEVQGIEAAPGGGYTIVARANDQRGIQRIFRSSLIARDPGPKMLGRSSVEVIVDPNDYGTYEIDLAFLKE